MRIRTTKTKNGRLFYVIRTYYDTNGKEHSVTVEKLGNENAIREKYNCDPDVWAKAYVSKLNEQEKLDKKPIDVSFYKNMLISKNHQYSFNVGYLFLQSLYYKLGLNKICRQISKSYQFEYDLNDILSKLIYGRIIHPCSKIATYEFSKKLMEQPAFDEHQIYRALDVIGSESDYIQEKLYSNSFALGKRNSGVIYYDCTNFFFETEEADENGLRQYGKSKENRPLPIVEMGMFIDSDGIPLSVCIHPGNTNEQITLKPLEKKLLSDFHMSKFVVCTDAGLASKANRRFNNIQNRAFIVTQSIKKLKDKTKEWALGSDGWKKFGEKRKLTYSIDNLDAEKDYNTVFYKERWIDQGSFEERLIVTFSMKYQVYQRKVRDGQIDRALRAIDNGTAKAKRNANDYRRFIEKISVTSDGEVAEKTCLSLNSSRIAEEGKYDGFYAVVTNLEDEPEQIIKVNKQRWKIEECFRIMKTEFSSRPAYVRTGEHIKAHFLICFLSLVIYRYLEREMKYQYTCEQLIDTLKDMNMREVVGEGYIPTYTRTEITDALHNVFNIRTDYQIITKQNMKKIIKATKTQIRHANF